MSYLDTESTATVEQAQEAVEDGTNLITNDELRELYPELRGEQVDYKVMEMQRSTPPPEPEEPRARAREGRKTYRTGPKGVITDYNEAKLKLQAKRHNQKMYKESKKYMKLGDNKELSQFEIIDPESNNTKLKNRQLKFKETAFTKRYFMDKKDINKLSDEDSMDSDLSDNEEIMKEYKFAKMQQLSKYEAKYGDIKEVIAYNFETIVYKAPKDEWVIVFVFQDYLERCARLLDALTYVAKAHPHVKFVKARSDRIGLDLYPEVGLPTIICIRNGKQEFNFIAFHELIGGEPFEPLKIENFLIKQKVLTKSVVLPTKPTFKDKEELENNNMLNNSYSFKQTRINKTKSGRLNVRNNTFNNRNLNNNNIDDESSGSELDID